MERQIFKRFTEKKLNGQKSFAILIDPDYSFDSDKLKMIISQAIRYKADFFFVGGSYFLENNIEESICMIRELCSIPIILFPGNVSHISYKADAILFLSLISGRNPEYLIGQHVIAAPGLNGSGMEIIPTGYILIDGGRPSTVSYITFSNPIPQDQPGLIMATAMAGEMLGMKIIYLEAGSGAITPVSSDIIRKVIEKVNLPLIVGGGINTIEKAQNALHAGADVIVVGNKIDEIPDFIGEISEVTRLANKL
jgi:putative glycerol-1-phosphate prenyltransferase